MNQASHYIDLLVWLFGDIKSVFAYTSKTRKIESEDSAVVAIKWKNGSLGTLNVTMLTYDKNYVSQPAYYNMENNREKFFKKNRASPVTTR